ncbi:MAG: sulfite exporter TauE/SafE family protein, partial [Vulcanimicrobiaceae bacterium]
MTLWTALPIGFAVGILGTLIGAGGGFLLVPILVLLEPDWGTETVTAFSLAVVTANALAGSISYLRLRRVDIASIPFFAAAAVPGAVAGAFLSALVPRRLFDAALGLAIILAAAALLRPPRVRRAHRAGDSARAFTDSTGNRYEWEFDLRLGMAGSAAVGLVSSLLGIGGGIVHVPFLIAVLGFPEHVATATSHAVLAVTAAAATIVHIAHGDFHEHLRRTLLCAGGALLGAPLGARLATHVPGRVIAHVLAVALGLVGLRLLFSYSG